MRNCNHNLENIHQGIHIFLKNSACLETEINLKVSLIIDNKLYNVFKIHQKILSFSFGKCSYGIFKKPFLNYLSLFSIECTCLILQTYAPNPCLSRRFLCDSKKSDHLQDACVWLFTDQYQQIAKKHRSKHHGIE